MLIVRKGVNNKDCCCCCILNINAYSLVDSELTEKYWETSLAFLCGYIKTGSPNVNDAPAQSINRGVHNGFAFANFNAHRFSYLNITSLGTDYVLNGEECGFACVGIPSCFSYNLAAFYDINGVLCELLPSDKYNNSDNFTSSQLFHHFSIVVCTPSQTFWHAFWYECLSILLFSKARETSEQICSIV